MNIRHIYHFFFILLCFTFKTTLKADNIIRDVDWQLIKNNGQWKEGFIFKAQIPAGWFFLQENGYTLNLVDQLTKDGLKDHLHHTHFKSDTSFTQHYHAIQFNWNNCNKPKNISSVDYSFYHNYFIGNNPIFWKTKVPVSKSVTLHQLYDGIDWHVKGPNFSPKHELIVAKNIDLSQISFTINGANNLYIDKKGRLVIETSLGKIAESNPIAWQIIAGKKVPVICKFKQIDKKTFTYDVKNYNRNFELIIDPELVFSTYSGSLGDNFGFTATFDSKGHLYAGGIVDGNDGNFPTTIGAFQVNYGGSTGGQRPIFLACDISISKYAPDGTSLMYATYLGGERNEHPHSLVVDNQDNLIVFGTSNSSNFPVDSFGFDTSYNGNYDIIISKFSENGASLLGGTFLGGLSDDGINNGLLRFNYADDFRGDIYVDSFNMIYLATTTRSAGFPTKNATQAVPTGGNDAVIVKLDSLVRDIQWSTYLGGTSDDAAYSIKLIDSIAYVAGGTSSPGMDRYATGAFTSYLGGISDGFIASFNASSGKLIDFTFYGTSAYDQIYFLDYDSQKRLYFTGQTQGNITKSPNTYGQNNTGQFISRIDRELKNIDLSTTFGTRIAADKPDLSPSAFLVDRCDNVYFSGWGANIDINPGSTRNLPITSNALQTTTDENDFYLIVFGNDLYTLLFATYFGGSDSEDHVDGGTSRFDKNGVIYQSVCASCPAPGQSFLNDFPVSNDAVFTQNFSRRCSNAAFKIDFRITYNIIADFTADPLTGCSPLDVTFLNNSFGGKSFLWNFGDGNVDTLFNPVHTYVDSGFFPVMLVVLDETSCNKTDTAYGEIIVQTGPETKFETSILPCDLIADFKNLSRSDSEFKWNLGDGTILTDKEFEHKYPFGGQFEVKLIATNPENNCVDSAIEILTFPSNPFTELEIPNVFTPNNDGKNDCYRILGISEECEQGEIWIYNRWGVLIYNGNIATECWNGKVQNIGEELPSGMYIYTLQTVRDKKQRIKTNGIIHLLREG